jgi:hypothetical protein
MTSQPPGSGPDDGPLNEQSGGPNAQDPSASGWAYPSGWERPTGQQPVQPNTFLPQGQQPPAGQWQTGYGQPPAGQWQQPPDGYQQPGGYGQAPGGGWQSGYSPQPGGYAGWTNQPPRRRNRGCLIVAIAVIVAVLVGVGGCAVVLVNQVGPAIALEMDIQGKSGGQITGSNYLWTNGAGTFTFTLAADVSPAEAKTLACNVIKPAMKRAGFESDRFIVLNDSGTQVASDRTPCT